jgi:hypothetical protein
MNKNGLVFMNPEIDKNSNKNTSNRQQPGTRRLKLLIVLIGIIVVAAAAAGVLYQRGNRQAQADYIKLIGNWIRPDGGYIINIRDINSDGRVQAEYYNPNPINVAQAKIAFKGNKVKLFLELRDAGYPGCTYDLTYDKQTDRLSGIYYQAAINQKFDIVFLRR